MSSSFAPPFHLTATCSHGLERSLSDELGSLGALDVVIRRRAVTFVGDLATLYAVNLRSRLSIRVLVELASGQTKDRDALYALASSVPWEELLVPTQTLAVAATGGSPVFRRVDLAALVVKDAVVDRLSLRQGVRPNVDRKQPDLRVNVHLSAERSAVSLDSSGPPLSHRGYRPRGGPAPLAESLAAGVLTLAGYDGTSGLLDPMCGTGTIVTEAAMIATRTAPGLRRSFAFERWPFHRPELLDRLRKEAWATQRAAPAPILAWDADQRAVAATQRNLVAAGVQHAVQVERRDVNHLQATPGTLVITNPPWGRRLGNVEELRSLYRRLGSRLKHHAPDCTAWLLVGEPALAREVGLRPQRRVPLFNGSVECRLLRYDLVPGKFGKRGAPTPMTQPANQGD